MLWDTGTIFTSGSAQHWGLLRTGCFHILVPGVFINPVQILEIWNEALFRVKRAGDRAVSSQRSSQERMDWIRVRESSSQGWAELRVRMLLAAFPTLPLPISCRAANSHLNVDDVWGVLGAIGSPVAPEEHSLPWVLFLIHQPCAAASDL